LSPIIAIPPIERGDRDRGHAVEGFEQKAANLSSGLSSPLPAPNFSSISATNGHRLKREDEWSKEGLLPGRNGQNGEVAKPRNRFAP